MTLNSTSCTSKLINQLEFFTQFWVNFFTMCGLRKRHFGPTDYQLGGSQESSAFHALMRVVESRVYFGERLLQVGGVSIAIKF
jgi:hypothetical protein